MRGFLVSSGPGLSTPFFGFWGAQLKASGLRAREVAVFGSGSGTAFRVLSSRVPPHTESELVTTHNGTQSIGCDTPGRKENV